MASELKVNVIVNASGDNDSGIDLATNDQVLIKTADTTAVTVDASQNVGIGTSSPVAGSKLTINDSAFGGLQFQSAGSDCGYIGVSSNTLYVGGGSTVAFHTGNAQATDGTERMRIDSSGRVLIGPTSAIGAAGGAKFQLSQSNNNWVHYIENYASSGAIYGTYYRFSGQAPDNTTSAFIQCEDSSAIRMYVYSDGDIYNHDGTFAQISDRRIKDNITDANSQWDDIKAMRFVNYQRKDDIRQYGESEAKVQLGLIGQELEAISPNLVRNVDPSAGDIISSSEFGSLYVEGDDIPEGKQVGDVKEVTEQVKGVAYSILYLKAVKALQEAMTRIETLETAKTDLEARITALENAE